ncbi:DNRLRE domain-containing protein, partial [bacterium]|nr:DNRLRE domain-containing protein [bacterium]
MITFSVTGDVPYGNSEVAVFQAIVDDHNLFSRSEFLVHVGDIKSGSGSCGEFHYERIASILKSLEVPRFILPGDNEWTDCSDEDQAWTFWEKHLLDLDKNFCHPPTIQRHSIRQELFAFVRKGVLFVSVNIIGGHNDSQILAYSSDWITRQLRDNGPDVRAAVIFAHASPRGSFSEEFSAAAIAFGKPVLYIHGNDHSWERQDNYLASNITRVSIDRGDDSPVHVTVTHDDRGNARIFLFERDPWPVGTQPYERPPCVETDPDSVIAGTSERLFQATDATFVRSDDPNRHYGDAGELRVRLSRVDYDTYLKFNVSGLAGPVARAKVRLHVTDGSDDGGEIYLVSNNYEGTVTPWDELGLTSGNAPAITAIPLSSAGSVGFGETV